MFQIELPFIVLEFVLARKKNSFPQEGSTFIVKILWFSASPQKLLGTHRVSEVQVIGETFTEDSRDPYSRLYPISLYRTQGEKISSANEASELKGDADLAQLAQEVLARARMTATCEEPVNFGDLPKELPEEDIGLLASTYIKEGLTKVQRYHAKFGDVGIKAMKKAMPNFMCQRNFAVSIVSLERCINLDIKGQRRRIRSSIYREYACTLTTVGPTVCLSEVIATLNCFWILVLDFCGLFVWLKKRGIIKLPRLLFLMLKRPLVENCSISSLMETQFFLQRKQRSCLEWKEFGIFGVRLGTLTQTRT